VISAPGTEGDGPVVAAGGVCWRIADGEPKVLLVHRAARADISLPKGKVDPGETVPEAAVREIHEETALAVKLGAPLGTVRYQLPGGRDKEVHYWSAEVDEHALELARFTPNDEIDALEWVALGTARRRLSYEHDVEMVDRLQSRLDAHQARTFAIILVRHGKAVDPAGWDGPDASRPLMHRGTVQAASIARGLAAFAPEKIFSSTAARCLSTVRPLAEMTGLEVKVSSTLSQDAFEGGRADVSGLIAKRIQRKKTVVLCSHGPVLPRLLAELVTQGGAVQHSDVMEDVSGGALPGADLGTGEVAVVHLSSRSSSPGVVAIESFRPAST